MSAKSATNSQAGGNWRMFVVFKAVSKCDLKLHCVGGHFPQPQIPINCNILEVPQHPRSRHLSKLSDRIIVVALDFEVRSINLQIPISVKYWSEEAQPFLSRLSASRLTDRMLGWWPPYEAGLARYFVELFSRITCKTRGPGSACRHIFCLTSSGSSRNFWKVWSLFIFNGLLTLDDLLLTLGDFLTCGWRELRILWLGALRDLGIIAATKWIEKKNKLTDRTSSFRFLWTIRVFCLLYEAFYYSHQATRTRLCFSVSQNMTDEAGTGWVQLFSIASPCSYTEGEANFAFWNVAGKSSQVEVTASAESHQGSEEPSTTWLKRLNPLPEWSLTPTSKYSGLDCTIESQFRQSIKLKD